MEVTNENFDDLLPEILEGIEKCSFISVDTELTGLHPTDEKENFFDTVEERYHFIYKSATKFLIVQYGMVLFFYDQKKDQFSHKAYNFYIFPKQFSTSAPNVRFLCEASSLEFLASWQFDFNKLIYKGIPYLTLAVEEKMKENYDKKQVYLAEENSTPLGVPENLKKFMDETRSQVKKLAEGEMKELFLDDLNPFQRKLVFNNIKPKFQNLYFETVVKDQPDATEQMDASSISESSDSEATATTPRGGVGSTANSNGGRPQTPTSQQRSSRRSYYRVLRVVKMTEEERKARDDEKKRLVMADIDKGVGFSKVIRKISETGKVVVGHNMVLDVAHSVHQFVSELPWDLASFKTLVQSALPNVVDTKLMCCTHPFREHFMSTVLGDVLKRVQEGPFSIPEFSKGSSLYSYDLGDNKCHEAGYDAFITGVCFIGLCQYLGTLQNPPKTTRVLPDSPLVMPFLNKLYLMRMLDISYLNISGTDLTPSRDHVFHVSCPKEATTKAVLDLFSPFGSVQVRWQDDNNLYVSLQDKDQAPLVMRNIEYDKAAYKIVPFSQYQQSSAKHNKRPLDQSKKSGNKSSKGNNNRPPKKNPKGPRQHNSSSTSSTASSSSSGGSDEGNSSPQQPDTTAHHQKKKRPKTEKPSFAARTATSSTKANTPSSGNANNKPSSTTRGGGKGSGSTAPSSTSSSATSSALHFDEPSSWD